MYHTAVLLLPTITPYYAAIWLLVYYYCYYSSFVINCQKSVKLGQKEGRTVHQCAEPFRTVIVTYRLWRLNRKTKIYGNQKTHHQKYARRVHVPHETIIYIHALLKLYLTSCVTRYFGPSDSTWAHNTAAHPVSQGVGADFFFSTVGCATRMYFQLVLIVVPLSFYKK